MWYREYRDVEVCNPPCSEEKSESDSWGDVEKRGKTGDGS